LPVIEFRDDEGRPWRLALTIGAALRVRDMVSIDSVEEQPQEDGSIKRVRSQVPFDIGDVSTIGQTFQILRSQFVKAGEVLYAILLAQVSEKGLTKEQFLDGLRGDSMEAATKALESELADFFPQRLRRMVRLIGSKMDEVAAEMLDRAEAQVTEATAESLAAPSGMPSGKPPESSDATPANGQSANYSPQGMPV
jgi:hypothetical protein